MEGSVVYGISVPPKDQVRAVELLKSDLKTRRYWIIIHENGQGVQHPSPDVWEERAPKKKLADLLTLVEYDRSTDLGSVLRSAQVANAGLAFPYVSAIKFMRREYLDGTNQLKHGHEVKIEMVVSLRQRIGGARYRFQVWDGGKQLQWMGGNEWWQGTETAVLTNQRKYDKRP